MTKFKVPFEGVNGEEWTAIVVFEPKKRKKKPSGIISKLGENWLKYVGNIYQNIQFLSAKSENKSSGGRFIKLCVMLKRLRRL